MELVDRIISKKTKRLIKTYILKQTDGYNLSIARSMDLKLLERLICPDSVVRPSMWPCRGHDPGSNRSGLLALILKVPVRAFGPVAQPGLEHLIKNGLKWPMFKVKLLTRWKSSGGRGFKSRPVH